MQRHLGDEVQGGVAADPALEEPRGGGGPGDGVLLLVSADALEGKRCSHEVLAQSLAGGLVEDAGSTLENPACCQARSLRAKAGLSDKVVREQVSALIA